MIELIPKQYQQKALETIKQTKQEGKNNFILQMASGLGKTYLAGFESLNYDSKVLFLCHRREILKQSLDVFKEIYKHTYKRGYSLGLFHGYKKEINSKVLFASVQALKKKEHLNKFDTKEFDLIIVDEFHHALASSYRKIINYFEPKFWLAMSATPYRLDDPKGEKLQALFNSKISFSYDLYKGITENHLAPFTLIFHRDNIDYSKIRYNNYRYNEKDLNKALLIKERDNEIIKEYKTHFINRKCIGFCVSVKHVNRMVKLFNQNGIEAEGITYNTHRNERDRIERDFKSGSVKILFTRDIYNEGVDIPEIDGVMLLRPTIAKAVFYQQIGRGLRRSDYKKDVVILDFVGNYKNANLHHKWLAKQIVEGAGLSRDKKPEYIYPPNCKVIFDKEIIDLFRELEPATKDDLISDYNKVKLNLGKPPSALDYSHYGKYDRSRFERLWGSWLNFKIEMGDNQVNITKEQIKEQLLKFKEKNGFFPSVRELREYGLYSDNTIRKAFGSYAKCIGLLGGKVRKFTKLDMSKERVIEDYLRIKRELGKVPFLYEIEKKVPYAIDSAIRQYFHNGKSKVGGEYKLFLQFMGDYETWKIRMKTVDKRKGGRVCIYSKEKVIRDYLKVYNKLGRHLTRNELRKRKYPFLPSTTTLAKILGISSSGNLAISNYFDKIMGNKNLHKKGRTR